VCFVKVIYGRLFPIYPVVRTMTRQFLIGNSLDRISPQAGEYTDGTRKTMSFLSAPVRVLLFRQQSSGNNP
jgi:hypothetical protein